MHLTAGTARRHDNCRQVSNIICPIYSFLISPGGSMIYD